MSKIPDEILLELADNLSKLRPKDAQRRRLVKRTAAMFGCSCETVYRQIARLRGPRQGILHRANCDRWMQRLGISIRQSLRQTPAVRFEAQQSNECWQFDISVSDAHYLAEQKVLPEAGQSGYPHLGLFSVVDDHSRVNFQEYHLVYGEEVEAGLLFLFRAMAAKDDPSFPFQGIPKTIYMDNGPLAKSRVVRRVLEEKLGITIKVHETPQQAGSRRTAARSKGKVERCFRTLKESFETLSHFPVAEANEWLMKLRAASCAVSFGSFSIPAASCGESDP